MLFEAVKIATASVCLHGRSERQEIPHQLEIEQLANAARQNIHLCRQLLRLRRPAALSVANIHYCFNAALSLELHQVLHIEEVVEDLEHISFTTSLLDADQGSNKELAQDCSKVLADLRSMMDRFRKTHSHLSMDRGSSYSDSGSANADQSASKALVYSNLSAVSEVLHSQATLATRQQLGSNDTSPQLPAERNSAYTDLLSWLQNDSMQPGP